MVLNDFKPGQTVYVLRRTRGRTTEHFIKRYTVLSVGRKYVKAAPEGSQHPEEFYLYKKTDEYLTENAPWREQMKLFLTEAAVNDDIEKDMLRSWLRRATGDYKIDNYTLNQLRAVKAILEDQESLPATEIQDEGSKKTDWFTKITDNLRDYSEGEIWSTGDNIMCKTESVANALADMFQTLYKVQGDNITVHTGYYDPEEDERNGETDRYTGWWYLNIE